MNAAIKFVVGSVKFSDVAEALTAHVETAEPIKSVLQFIGHEGLCEIDVTSLPGIDGFLHAQAQRLHFI